jgi:hypothetical protein
LINNLIEKYIYDKVNNNVDCRLLWDVLKIEIREATIIYCKSKSKFNREARRSLEKELHDVSTREQKSVPINIISIRLACVLSFRRQVNCCLS